MSGLVFDSEYGVHFVTPLVTLFKESPHFSVLDLHRKTRFGQQGASVCVYFQKKDYWQFVLLLLGICSNASLIPFENRSK